MKRTVIMAMLLALITATPSLAQPRHRAAQPGHAGVIECTREGCFPRSGRPEVARTRGNQPRPTAGGIWDMKFIPNPPGTWRIALSCAHRLAAYWGLGSGLDSVAAWPKRFPRASGPAPGVAAVRPGHIVGIVGGGPGAWRVVDFNSGGHLNREYTTDRIYGTLVDTNRREARHERNSAGMN